MPYPNYVALTEGVKHYTDAMREFVKGRLVDHFHNDWWRRGVIDSLSPGQRKSLETNQQNNPGKAKADYLEPVHVERIILRNFQTAFKGDFADYEKTQGWLMQASVARNFGTTHSVTGDLLADDVANYLLAMVRILERADPGAAAEVERIRKRVLHIAPEPEPIARPAMPEPASGALPYWWQVCEPHDAFKNPATIDESIFAANLAAVVRGNARAEFQDPAIFFAHTYFTENLTQTIRDVAGRMSGGVGPSVTEMQTPFGGGKTHALVALYHLIKDPARSLAVPGVREALGDIQIPAGAKVLAFDGQDWGTEALEKEDSTTVQTLWGELAYQADPDLFFRRLRDSDSRGEAPGNAVYRQVLEASSPCLIVIDELVSYLVKLRFSTKPLTKNLYRQTIQFLQDMLQEVGNVPGVCVLLSLPKSKGEFGGLDPVDLAAQLGVLEDLQARADRVVSKRTPVNDDEIYTLMSKRLFKTVDPVVAERAARAFRAVYERDPELYDAGVLTQDYLRQQVAAYPLHPELIDILYKKWSTATDFPRTRAVLQLLASIVADHWVSRPEAYAIQPSQVNLERERIRTRIVSAAGAGGGYDAVVAADIIGGDAHADMLDQTLGGEYERFHIARGVATTLLMSSFGGRGRTGALPADLYLGSVAPNLEPSYVREVIDSLEQRLWYVHREGELRRFQTQINVYRAISERAAGQPAERVVEGLREALTKVLGSSEGFRVMEWAAADGSLPDRPEPTIAVLAPKYAVRREDDGFDGRAAIDALWERAGGGLRQWRNALILVAPDRELWEGAERLMREVLAYESVTDAGQRRNSPFEVSDQELKRLKAEQKDKRDSLAGSVASAYRWVFWPDEQGLSVTPLAVPASRGATIVGRVVERLSNQDYGQPKILTKMSAGYFNAKLAPRLWKDEEGPLDLAEGVSRRLPQWTYLPILPTRDKTLRDCIKEGIGQKLWAVAVGDTGTDKYRQLIERPGELDALVTLFDGSASLVRGTYRDLVREQLRRDTAGAESESEAAPEEEIGAFTSVDGAAGPSHGLEPAAPQAPKPTVIAAPKRHSRVRLAIPALPIAKTSNLQPYLFKVLQEQDALAKVTVTIEVESGAGIDEAALESRIVEGFDMLGIEVRWESR